jgi:proton-dependent oligopeptide transporter, POT family
LTENKGYLTPILGAIIADQYLGRYKTILIFCYVYMLGLLVLTLTALPTAMAHGAGTGGFVTAIIRKSLQNCRLNSTDHSKVIGIGTGGIKSNVAPLIADQYTRKHMAIKTLKTGERVIIDPAITFQRIYMIFYWCINLGSLSLMGTTYMKR